jgi:hypothetical protein
MDYKDTLPYQDRSEHRAARQHVEAGAEIERPDATEIAQDEKEFREWMQRRYDANTRLAERRRRER